MIAAEVLGQMLAYENLTPLTSDPDEWVDRTEISNLPASHSLWQSVRNSRAFSDDHAVTYWLVDDNDDGAEATRYPTEPAGIRDPGYRQDPNPLPPPVGVFAPCERMAEPTTNPGGIS